MKKKEKIVQSILTRTFTDRPKKLLRRNRFNAMDIKHVPRRIINESNALFGKSLSSFDIRVLLDLNDDEMERREVKQL